MPPTLRADGPESGEWSRTAFHAGPARMQPHRNMVTCQSSIDYATTGMVQLDLDCRALQHVAAWFVPSPDDMKRTYKALSKFDAKFPLLLHARQR